MFPKIKIDRPPSLALMAQLAAVVLGVGVIGAAGYGLGASSVPETKPIVRTIVRDTPPACVEAIEAARTERAHTATQRQHEALAAEFSAALPDVVLTRVVDKIESAAEDLDAENRLVQQAGLDAATAAAAFDAAADECTGGAR